MSFTHRLFHLVWSCSQNGFLKLSYRTLEAKSWCSFSKYNDYALFQSNCSMCYMSKKKKHIEIFEKKISLRGSQFKEKQYSVSIIELFTLLNEKIKFSFFTRFFYELVGRSDIYFDLYRGIIITVIMVIISQDWNINLCFFNSHDMSLDLLLMDKCCNSQPEFNYNVLTVPKSYIHSIYKRNHLTLGTLVYMTSLKR